MKPKLQFARPRALAIAGLFVWLSLTSVAAQAQNTSTLTIRITGARNAKGQIGVALFRDATGFPGDSSKAFRTQQVKIDPHTWTAEIVFEAIPRGVYAVSVFHDENLNGKLDKNFMGVPKEGYGASNNPRKRMGPPPFDEARFTLDQPQQLVEINLMY
jgi:uncharacterized protein (DUF2141 family)